VHGREGGQTPVTRPRVLRPLPCAPARATSRTLRSTVAGYIAPPPPYVASSRSPAASSCCCGVCRPAPGGLGGEARPAAREAKVLRALGPAAVALVGLPSSWSSWLAARSSSTTAPAFLSPPATTVGESELRNTLLPSAGWDVEAHARHEARPQCASTTASSS